MGDQPRGLSMEVFLSEDAQDLYPDIRASIALYRATARQVFACLFAAQAAGAEISVVNGDIRVTPENTRSKTILAQMFDRHKPDGTEYHAPVYECREYVLQTLAPTWKAFVWDSLRATCWERWQARDPQLAATRGYLALNGVRRLADCAYIGIQFPVKTAAPKLDGNKITLHWDRDIGPVTFVLPKLDGGRWHVWRNIRDGAWKLGTVTLTERDGRLRVQIAYHLPTTADTDLDPASVLAVFFGDAPESAIRLAHDGAVDDESAVAAVSQLRRLRGQTAARQRALAACGNRNGIRGFKGLHAVLSEKLGHITEARLNTAATWNHVWTRHIVQRARALRCGRIQVGQFPDDLFGHPWQWGQFRQDLEYKASASGITVALAVL